MDEDEKFQKGNTAVCRIGLKAKRSGETRVRVGFFVADRIMPYVADGIAYAQIQGVDKVSETKKSGKMVNKVKKFLLRYLIKQKRW